MTNQEIIELAALTIAVDKSPDDADLGPQLQRGLDRMSGNDAMALMLAYKLLEGKRYSISSDNPATLSRCRALAAEMGAMVSVGGTNPLLPAPLGNQTLLIEPSPTQ
jgi:hypothetical protein